MKFTLDAAIVLGNRRSSHFYLPKSSNWTENGLTNFDDGRWRQMLRVSKEGFYHLLTLVESDEVFQHFSICPQMPVDLQLKIALFRFGSNGDSASIRKVATLFGIGDGETVITATKRVIKAILNLKSKYLFWLSRDERKRLVSETLDELPGCIGYVDGTEIRLAESPAGNNKLFCSRKKQYAIKMQVVCDHNLRIRHAVIGHYGSVHDARIFNECSLAEDPQKFFSEKEFLAGDSAYAMTQNLITPFRSNSSDYTEEIRLKFNTYFSKFRVRIENCFKDLKEVFCSLKEMRFRLIDEDSYLNCCSWILACCIIHNIMLGEEKPAQDESNIQVEYPEEMNNKDDIREALVNFITNNS